VGGAERGVKLAYRISKALEIKACESVWRSTIGVKSRLNRGHRKRTALAIASEALIVTSIHARRELCGGRTPSLNATLARAISSLKWPHGTNDIIYKMRRPNRPAKRNGPGGSSVSHLGAWLSISRRCNGREAITAEIHRNYRAYRH